jgi:hypothetical protein
MVKQWLEEKEAAARVRADADSGEFEPFPDFAASSPDEAGGDGYVWIGHSSEESGDSEDMEEAEEGAAEWDARSHSCDGSGAWSASTGGRRSASSHELQARGPGSGGAGSPHVPRSCGPASGPSAFGDVRDDAILAVRPPPLYRWDAHVSFPVQMGRTCLFPGTNGTHMSPPPCTNRSISRAPTVPPRPSPYCSPYHSP